MNVTELWSFREVKIVWVWSIFSSLFFGLFLFGGAAASTTRDDLINLLFFIAPFFVLNAGFFFWKVVTEVKEDIKYNEKIRSKAILKLYLSLHIINAPLIILTTIVIFLFDIFTVGLGFGIMNFLILESALVLTIDNVISNIAFYSFVPVKFRSSPKYLYRLPIGSVTTPLIFMSLGLRFFMFKDNDITFLIILYLGLNIVLKALKFSVYLMKKNSIGNIS